MLDAGTQPVALEPEQDARFKAIGQQVTEARLETLAADGLPAREVYQKMQALADEHAASSKNFWAK